MIAPAVDGSPPMTPGQRAAWQLGRADALTDVVLLLDFHAATSGPWPPSVAEGYRRAVAVVQRVTAHTTHDRARVARPTEEKS